MFKPTPKFEVKPITVPGIYGHYKGGLYRVLGTALDSETKKQTVIYMSLEHGTIWSRDEAMFNEMITENGITQPRFKLLREVCSPLEMI